MLEMFYMKHNPETVCQRDSFVHSEPKSSMWALHLLRANNTGKQININTPRHKHQHTENSCMLYLERPLELHRSPRCWFPVDGCSEWVIGQWSGVLGRGVMKIAFGGGEGGFDQGQDGDRNKEQILLTGIGSGKTKTKIVHRKTWAECFLSKCS